MTSAGKRHSSLADNLKSAFLSSGNALPVITGRTTGVDRMVRQAFQEKLAGAAPEGVALLAVGGYGRRQLFPHSDVDLLLLFDTGSLAQSLKESIAAFLQTLWDAHLRVSHSVRTPAECSELHDRNVELNVSLLDQRYMVGDRVVYGKLSARLPRFVHSQRDALSRNLTQLARERHEKFHQTLYHLEPNIKETPGGLRDFQLLCWLDQIKRTSPTSLAGAEPPRELDSAIAFLNALRCYLHFDSQRDRNVLGFEAQENIAELWHRDDAGALMREYFRKARAIYREAIRLMEASEAKHSVLFSQFRDWRSRLSNAEFTVLRERVHFRVPQQMDTDPPVLLRLFQFVARHGLRLSPEAEGRIVAHRAQIQDYFGQPRPIWPELREMLSLDQSYLGLRAMHETGLLTAIFPELESIECLVIRDFYHRYTVDEHTLVCIQNLSELKEPFAGVWRELEDPATLKFALLFHDAGKGDDSQGHVAGSLEAAATAMRRIGIPNAVQDEVRFLIGGHLELSAAMQSRDLHDPATAQSIAHRIGTVERLKALTLLTHADISGVFPGAMTPWRAELLWQLYLLVYRELTRELDSERIEAPQEFSEAARLFIEGFPRRYVLTHKPEEIEAHAALHQTGLKRGVSLQVERAAGVWRVTLIAADRPGLFAAVAGTLSSFGMNILKAEAFANRQNIILDTFLFADPSRTLELNPPEVDRLRVTIERVVLGKADVKQLLQNRPKPVLPSRKAGIAPTVAFDPEVSSTATLIQIVAEDRPGLLYDIAQSISGSGCNIEVVLIDTEAHKAIDVFYVTENGAKLSPVTQQLTQSRLHQAILS